MKRKASEVSESDSNPEVMEEMNVIVEEVPTNLVEILSQVHENCRTLQGSVLEAEEETKKILTEAEKQKEVMKLELENWEEEKKTHR